MANASIAIYNAHLFEKTIVEVSQSQIYLDAQRQVSLTQQLLKGGADLYGLSEVWASVVQDSMKSSFRSVGMDSYSYQTSSLTKLNPGTLMAAGGSMSPPPMGFQAYQGLVGADYFAEKGVTYGEVRLPQGSIFVIQTHTQASYVGSEAKDEAARERSIHGTLFPIIDQALSNFGGPIFLLGDLNIIAGSDEYQKFNREMNMRGFWDTWPSINANDPGYTYDPESNKLVQHFDPKQTVKQRLDYIYFRKDNTKPIMSKVLKWKTEDGIDVSDHYGVEATFEF